MSQAMSLYTGRSSSVEFILLEDCSPKIIAVPITPRTGTNSRRSANRQSTYAKNEQAMRDRPRLRVICGLATTDLGGGPSGTTKHAMTIVARPAWQYLLPMCRRGVR